MPPLSKNSDPMSRPQTVPAVINLGFQSSPDKIPVTSRQNQQMNRRSSLQTNFKNIWKSSNLFREKQSKKVLNGQKKSHLDNELIFQLEQTCILPNSSMDASKIKKWTRYRDTNSPPDVTLNARQIQTDICLDHSGELLPAICTCTRKNNILTRKGQTNIFMERKWTC